MQGDKDSDVKEEGGKKEGQSHFPELSHWHGYRSSVLDCASVGLPLLSDRTQVIHRCGRTHP